MSGDKKTIEVHQQTPVTVKFKLKGPENIWRATLAMVSTSLSRQMVQMVA